MNTVTRRNLGTMAIAVIIVVVIIVVIRLNSPPPPTPPTPTPPKPNPPASKLSTYPFYPWMKNLWSSALDANEEKICYDPKFKNAPSFLNDGIYNEFNLCDAPHVQNWYECHPNSFDYCRASARFNWIIATCTVTEPINETTIKLNQDALASVPPKPIGGGGTCDLNPHSSEMIVNYVGSFQYDKEKDAFVAQEDSCFNIDGFYDSYNTSRRYGGLSKDKPPSEKSFAWLPGPFNNSAANWRTAYYPAGKSGVSAPAMMFVMSVDVIQNACFFALNQTILNRGPAKPLSAEYNKELGLFPYKTTPSLPKQWPMDKTPPENVPTDLRMSGFSPAGKGDGVGYANTWGCNQSGEFDIIEPPCNSQPATGEGEFLKGFSTGFSGYNWGQGGRCLFWNKGCYEDAYGDTDGAYGGGGWGRSQKYFKMDTPQDRSPRVFVCIIDQYGMKTFQVPTHDGAKEYFQGIRRKTIERTIPARFNSGPPTACPCDYKTEFCATFNPWCPKSATTPEQYEESRCAPLLKDRGFLNNWVHKKLIGIPALNWASETSKPSVNGKKIGDWNKGMEGRQDAWINSSKLQHKKGNNPMRDVCK